MRSLWQGLVLAIATTSAAAAAAEAPEPSLWFDTDPPALVADAGRDRWLDLDERGLRSLLASAGKHDVPRVLSLPMPDGSTRRFVVQRAEAMPAELAARYPEIQAWRGTEADGGVAAVRFELTPSGFSAMVFAPGTTSLVFPEPTTGLYRSVARDKIAAPPPHCDVTDADQADRLTARYLARIGAPAEAKVVGPTVRTYRAAIAATAEYTAVYGSAIAGLGGIVSAVNRINQVYENELGIRLQLVANNNVLVFTDTITDGYSNDDVAAMLDQNQAKLDIAIGNANYDVGHVFATSGGGIAQVGAVCAAGFKAKGVSGSSFPNNDLFWIDIVAHEIGHQLDAFHSFNSVTGFCNGSRDPGSAYEPGSGTTIMAYAGICSDAGNDENIAIFSTPNFHVHSLEQIHRYSQSPSEGAACGTVAATGNATPVVTATANAIIPARTPFQLTASATDANGDALTYSWEQFDLGTASPPLTDNGFRPLFRAFPPRTSPTRLFPQLSDVRVGRGVPPDFTKGEVLPTTNRTMNFRAVVRDNRAGGGGVQWSGTTVPPISATQVTVVDTGAAFAITNFNTASNATAGVPQALTWNVAGTTAAPISCANVEIAFSRDDGATFPTVLTASTPNDGSESVTLPAPATNDGRLRVRCTSSIFLDINNAKIALAADTTAPAVGSSNRAEPDPAQGAPVRFTVMFSEAVTGVDAADFTASVTGTLAGVAVQSVSGIGTTWSVAVATGTTGSGTVRLDVVDNDSILDPAGNPLGGPGAGNGNFTAGQVYTVVPANFTIVFRDGFE